MQNLHGFEDFRLIEKAAGDVLFKRDFKTSALAAEHLQAERWNENYCLGEPRVSSKLYRKQNGRWKLIMSLGV
jgi:hypothetical protein